MHDDPFSIADDQVGDFADKQKHLTQFRPCPQCGEPVLYTDSPIERLIGGAMPCLICCRKNAGTDVGADAAAREAGMKIFLALFDGSFHD